MYVYIYFHVYIYIHIYIYIEIPWNTLFIQCLLKHPNDFAGWVVHQLRPFPNWHLYSKFQHCLGICPSCMCDTSNSSCMMLPSRKNTCQKNWGKKIECLFLRWDRQKTSSVDDLCILFHYLLMLLSDSCSWVITMHFLEFCGCFFLTWSLVRQFWWLRFPGWSWDPWDDETWIWPPSHMDPPAHPTMRTSSCLSKTKHSTWFAAAKDLLKKKWGQKLNENKICIWGILI